MILSFYLESLGFRDDCANDTERKKLLVLIVEDDSDIRTLAATCFEAWGHIVISAESGEEGLRILRDGGPIDLLFTDIVMPGTVNGLELADWAAKRYPAMRILLTSGYIADPAARRLPFLPKPYLPNMLSAAVERIRQSQAA